MSIVYILYVKLLKGILEIIIKNLSSIIISSAIIIAALIYAYFNPYQSCLRTFGSIGSTLNSQVASICSGSGK